MEGSGSSCTETARTAAFGIEADTLWERASAPRGEALSMSASMAPPSCASPHLPYARGYGL